MNNNLGDIIKKLREGLGLTPKQLAEKSGFTLSYIFRLEANEYKNISLITSRKLADALNLSLSDFLGEIGFLEKNEESPTMKMVVQAFRKNGFSEKNIKEIVEYAEFRRNTKK